MKLNSYLSLVCLDAHLSASLGQSASGFLISDLPGLTWYTNYNKCSGFLSLDNGQNLHFWFLESQNDVSSDPVTLWVRIICFSLFCFVLSFYVFFFKCFL